MDPDEHICLCFRVSRRKINNFLRREKPKVASQVSECLGAGTGCGWCVPFLKSMHEQFAEGVADPDLPFSPEEYARRRTWYREKGERPADDQAV